MLPMVDDRLNWPLIPPPGNVTQSRKKPGPSLGPKSCYGQGAATLTPKASRHTVWGNEFHKITIPKWSSTYGLMYRRGLPWPSCDLMNDTSSGTIELLMSPVGSSTADKRCATFIRRLFQRFFFLLSFPHELYHSGFTKISVPQNIL